MGMTSMRFERAAAIVLDHEKGYVNDRSDRGGETKFGISKKSYPHLDIGKITWLEAKQIYFHDYWQPCRCDELPPALAILVFDAAINSGPGQARKWLQRAAGVAPDGVLGPVSMAAVRKPGVAEMLQVVRADAMNDMPTWRNHGGGWLMRMSRLPFQALAAAREEDPDAGL